MRDLSPLMPITHTNKRQSKITGLFHHLKGIKEYQLRPPYIVGVSTAEVIHRIENLPQHPNSIEVLRDQGQELKTGIPAISKVKPISCKTNKISHLESSTSKVSRLYFKLQAIPGLSPQLSSTIELPQKLRIAMG